MKKMQCNALNIKTVAKQVWFYFIRGTKRSGYAGIISDIISSYPKKYLPKFSYPKKSRNRKFQTPQNFWTYIHTKPPQKSPTETDMYFRTLE